MKSNNMVMKVTKNVPKNEKQELVEYRKKINTEWEKMANYNYKKPFF